MLIHHHQDSWDGTSSPLLSPLRDNNNNNNINTPSLGYNANIHASAASGGNKGIFSLNNIISFNYPAIKRTLFVDVFRGFLIAGFVICFLSQELKGYSEFRLSDWDGLTFYDMIFPGFLFCLGLTIALTVDTMMAKDQPKFPYAVKACRRTVILFLLGFFLSNYQNRDISTWRVFGPLQRISICYGFVNIAVIGIPHTRDGRMPRVFLQYIYQWIFAIILLVIYFAVLFGTKVDCPLSYDNRSQSRTGDLGPYCNAAYMIDEKIVTRNHMYRYAGCKLGDEIVTPPPTPPFMTETNELFDFCLDFEPEGILGTFTAIFTVFLGLHAGRIIRHYTLPSQRFIHWLGFAIFCVIIAIPLDATDTIPYNKNLWSFSFMLVNAAVNFAAISVCYGICEVLEKSWILRPFEIMGQNSIIIYIITVFVTLLLQNLYDRDLTNTLWNTITDWTDGSSANVFIFASLYLLLFCLPLSLYLYEKKIIYKI